MVSTYFYLPLCSIGKLSRTNVYFKFAQSFLRLLEERSLSFLRTMRLAVPLTQFHLTHMTMYNTIASALEALTAGDMVHSKLLV